DREPPPRATAVVEEPDSDALHRAVLAAEPGSDRHALRRPTESQDRILQLEPDGGRRAVGEIHAFRRPAGGAAPGDTIAVAQEPGDLAAEADRRHAADPTEREDANAAAPRSRLGGPRERDRGALEAQLHFLVGGGARLGGETRDDDRDRIGEIIA